MAQDSDRRNGTIARLATREKLGAGFLLICAAITGIEAVAVVALVVLAALPETGRRPLGVLALALVLVVLVWLVFRLGLNLQLPMLPGNRG